MPTARPRRRQRGLTLVEATVSVGLCAVLAGIAVPSFERTIERRHLEAVAAQVETDIALARSLAVAQNQTVRLRFVGARCYVVHTGPAGDCECSADGVAACGADTTVLRSARLDDDGAVALHSSSASMTFDAVKGTVTPTATVRVVSRSGEQIRNVVNVMGRVRSCTPTPGLPGYAAC